MTPMRVLISIDKLADRWVVKTVIPGIADRILLRTPDGQGGETPLPDPAVHGAEAFTGLAALAAESGPLTLAAYSRLMRRAMRQGDADDFGRYLFDCALGFNWSAIRDHARGANVWFIELALSWNSGDSALSRLPWELMRDADGYLSNGYIRDGRRVDVAITRLVPDSTTIARQIEGLPRVLFVVGTSLTDASVRPAAEILCMLKRTRDHQRRMHPRMVEKASPSRIKDAVASFRPDVVHLLCHGGIRGGVPFLQLQSETASGEEQFSAQQIAAALTAGETIPAIVLLSACQSGTAEAPSAVTMSTEAAAPFAAQLVHFGLPAVIGMSGKISDVACRLFTRRFAESLLGAEPLVLATAEGRRAAFSEGRPPQNSIDWAFPAVFLSGNVPPDYRPADPAAPPDDVEMKIRAYEVETMPIFCGRQDFFHDFESLPQPRGPAVLAAHTEDATAGYGRKRLLEELAIQAILEGHVPCLVTRKTWNDGQPPRTPLALALQIDKAVETACRAFGVRVRPMSPAKRLQMYRDGNFDLAIFNQFDEEMQARLLDKPRDVSAAAALFAVERRLGELITAIRGAAQKRFEEAADRARARAAAPEADPLVRAARAGCDRMANARVVVFLESIHLYDSALDALRRRPGLGHTGLGTATDPVPVVVTFSLKTTASEVLDDMVQNQSAWPGWRFLPLKPFERSTGENVLAYSRVLLNPFHPGIVPEVSGRAWFMDDSVPEAIRERHIALFNTYLNGLPGEFLSDRFFMLADFAHRDDFLKEALDEQIIGRLEEERRLSGGRP